MPAASDRGREPALIDEVVHLGANEAKVERLKRVVAAAAATNLPSRRRGGTSVRCRPVLPPGTALCGPDILETPLELRCLLERQGLVDGVAQRVLDGRQLRLHLAARAGPLLQR